MRKIILGLCTISGLLISTLVFASGDTIWCKVSYGRFGDCKPYKQ